MDEADRIRALRDEGRIDDVQARRLLNALGVPDADAELRGGPIDAATDQLPDVRHWARVELFACELDVVVDGSLDAPSVETKEGDVGVETTEDGWRIAQRDRAEGSWLERLIDGVQQGRVKLRLPEATGVHLDVKAGDVDLDGVPALRGRLMAGDLDARGLRAVDVAVSAGDVDLAFDPSVGAHRIRLSVGDLSIRLPAHADVEVKGHVSIGDASASAPFVTKRTGMVAQLVQGTMGQGRATLRADVGTGDLTIASD